MIYLRGVILYGDDNNNITVISQSENANTV